MFTGNPGHLKGFDYVGLRRYFLTFCAFARNERFNSPERVEIAKQQILRAAVDQDMEIPAYCFMPDHAHFLVEGQSDDSDALAFIKYAKQFSAFHYQQSFGQRLWQRYGYERVLRDEEVTLSVIRYILENPVRAGLVERVADYPYVGSTQHTIGELLEAIQMAPRWSPP